MIRSTGAGVTVGGCKSCPVLVASHKQALDGLSTRLLLSTEPSCGTSIASGSTVKLRLGQLQGCKLGTSQRYGSIDHAAPADAFSNSISASFGARSGVSAFAFQSRLAAAYSAQLADCFAIAQLQETVTQRECPAHTSSQLV